MIYDTHCHLDKLSTLQLSQQIDPLNGYISVGTSSKDWLSVINLASQYPNVFPAIGLHPWFVDSKFSQQLDYLECTLNSSSFKALGEIGLDFSNLYRHNKSHQLSALERQLQLAEYNCLPISVHVYKAHNELLSMLKQFEVIGVIHGLGSSLEVAKSYLSLGYKIGVNGVIVRPNANRYHRMVQNLPMESFVLETDAPNVLLPEYSNSSLNDIYQVISKLSSLTGLTEQQVSQVTTETAQSIFKFKDNP